MNSQIKEIVQKNIWFTIVTLLGAYLLQPQWTLWYTTLFMTFLTFTIYWLHRWAHYHNNWYTNLHVKYHHQQIQSWKTKIIEFIFDISGSGAILALISILFGLENWISPTLCLYFALIYTGIHLYTNTYLKNSPQHDQHHRNNQCNFSPDICDHLFQTSFDHSVENNNQNIPVSITAFLIILAGKSLTELLINKT
jgi:sterol desaturase/sphingolipid hydroxylase (fatty acid hydroxylase superfamily)